MGSNIEWVMEWIRLTQKAIFNDDGMGSNIEWVME
jgi:hypothetical protein